LRRAPSPSRVGAQPERLHRGDDDGARLSNEMLEEFGTTGLAKASPEEMKIARRRRKVICFQITELGRKAAADY
jgi:hypothetical protein